MNDDMNKDEYKDEYGNKLIYDQQGLLTNSYGHKYMMGKDGQLHQLKSPKDGSTVYLNENGEYVSEYSDNKFYVDENGMVIPLEDPITHNGTAHIENGQLVSDVTGEKYDIDNNGNVLTPEEIANQQKAEEINKKIAEMEENGEIDNWLEEKSEQSTDTSKTWSADEIKDFINEQKKHSDEMINEILNEGIEKGITSEELSNANREINQAQKEFVSHELENQQAEDVVLGG